MNTILFKNEQNFYSDLEITFLVNEEYSDLFINYDGNIQILYLDKMKYRLSMRYRYFILKKLFAMSFFEVYNCNFYRLAIDDEIAIISGLNGKSFAFKNYPNLSRLFATIFENYYSKIFHWKGRSFIENYGLFLKFLVRSNEKINLNTYLSNTDSQNLEKLGLTKGRYFVMAPFSAAERKNWPIENYVQMNQQLTKGLNLVSVIVGNSHPLEDRFDNCINLIGNTTLKQVYNIIEHATFFIGNDSGLLHVANALNVSSYGIVGEGVNGIVYPYSKDDCNNYFYSRCDYSGCRWECKFDAPYCLADVKEDIVFKRILHREKSALE